MHNLYLLKSTYYIVFGVEVELAWSAQVNLFCLISNTPVLYIISCRFIKTIAN